MKLINMVLTDINFAMGYLDDIIIYSKTEEEHLEHLRIIFDPLKTSWTEAEAAEMRLLQEAHPVFRSSHLR